MPILCKCNGTSVMYYKRQFHELQETVTVAFIAEGFPPRNYSKDVLMLISSHVVIDSARFCFNHDHSTFGVRASKYWTSQERCVKHDPYFYNNFLNIIQACREKRNRCFYTWQNTALMHNTHTKANSWSHFELTENDSELSKFNLFHQHYVTLSTTWWRLDMETLSPLPVFAIGLPS